MKKEKKKKSHAEKQNRRLTAGRKSLAPEMSFEFTFLNKSTC